MSMIGYFLMVTSEQINQLESDPTSVAPFLDAAVEDQEELGADFLDIDKSWHGIHFVLTGSVRDGDPPLSWLVFAPTLIGEDVGYGPTRLLSPDQVIEVTKALAAIPPDKLKRKCDLGLLNESAIYPENWSAGDEDYLAENFAQLKKFYESAGRRRMGVVQWIS